MEIRTYLYDSFTNHLFGGNIARVILEAGGLDSETMQHIADELNAPTTGFVVHSELGPPPSFTVRYFTPFQEIDICGHVTIALFTALTAEEGCKVQPEGNLVYLQTSVGELPVFLYPGKEEGIIVEMYQKLLCFESPFIERTMVQEILRNMPLHPSLPVEIVSTGLRHLIVPFLHIGDLAKLNPNFWTLAKLSQTLKVDTICAFALSVGRKAQVRIRDFCPGIVTNEESANGTTSGALGCYLVKYDVISSKQQREISLQVEQGVEMGRLSQIEVRLSQIDGVVQRVGVCGQAIEVLKGKFFLRGD